MGVALVSNDTLHVGDIAVLQFIQVMFENAFLSPLIQTLHCIITVTYKRNWKGRLTANFVY